MTEYQELLKIGTAWATIFVAVVATVSLVYAAVQAHHVRIANEQSSKQARATFLLELDARFEGDDLSEARKLYNTTLDSLDKEIAAKNHRLDGPARHEKLAEAMADCLNEWQASSPKSYGRMRQYLGFFETVGLMVRQKYIKIDDVDFLFRGPILDLNKGLQQHIDWRQQKEDVPNGMYENALYLLKEVQKRSQITT
jgi:hypothetical protein